MTLSKSGLLAGNFYSDADVTKGAGAFDLLPKGNPGGTMLGWTLDSAREELQRFAIQASEFLEFDHIYPAFPALTFGDEGLRSTQLTGNVNLGEADLTTGLPESLEKRSVFLAMGCVLQSSPDYGECLHDIPNWDILRCSRLAQSAEGARLWRTIPIQASPREQTVVKETGARMR